MKLFVIEGIDGAGKSTQIKLLTKFLLERGFKTKYMHFPRTDEPFFGELIARFLRGEFGSLEEVDPWLVAMLYAGDRNDAAKTIRGWLNKGSIVLLDRYTFSNIAYQCAKVKDPVKREHLMDWIIDLEFNHFGIPRPDLNIFLDVPFSFTEKKLTSLRSGSDRDYLNGNKDIHEESLYFQQTVRQIYINLPFKDPKFTVVDCGSEKGEMLKPEEIFEKIVTVINEKKLL